MMHVNETNDTLVMYNYVYCHKYLLDNDILVIHNCLFTCISVGHANETNDTLVIYIFVCCMSMNPMIHWLWITMHIVYMLHYMNLDHRFLTIVLQDKYHFKKIRLLNRMHRHEV